MQVSNKLCLIRRMFTVANSVEIVFMFIEVFSTRASMAVVPLIFRGIWVASTFPLVNLTKVTTAAQSHVLS